MRFVQIHFGGFSSIGLLPSVAVFRFCGYIFSLLRKRNMWKRVLDHFSFGTVSAHFSCGRVSALSSPSGGSRLSLLLWKGPGSHFSCGRVPALTFPVGVSAHFSISIVSFALLSVLCSQVLDRALQRNDQKKVYLRMAKIYITTRKLRVRCGCFQHDIVGDVLRSISVLQ